MYQILIVFLKAIFCSDAFYHEINDSYDLVHIKSAGAEHSDKDRAFAKSRDLNQNLPQEISTRAENVGHCLVSRETENNGGVKQKQNEPLYNETYPFLKDTCDCIDCDSTCSSITLEGSQHSNSDSQYDSGPYASLPVQSRSLCRKNMLDSRESGNIFGQANQLAAKGRQTCLKDKLLLCNDQKTHEIRSKTLPTEDVWVLQKSNIEQDHKARGAKLLRLEDNLTTGLDIVCSAEGNNIEYISQGLVTVEMFRNYNEDILKKFHEFNLKYLAKKEAKQVKLLGNVNLKEVLFHLDAYISLERPLQTHDELKQLVFQYYDTKTLDRNGWLKFYYDLIQYLLHPNTSFKLNESEMEGVLVEELYRDSPDSCFFMMGKSVVLKMVDIKEGVDAHTVACISIMDKDNQPCFYSCSLHSRFLMVSTALIKGFAKKMH